jgi:probable addiction module antidote protein
MKLTSFKAKLYNDLRNDEFATAYLQDAWRDSQSEFLVALGDYVQATIGMTECAKRADVTRQALYRMLSDCGNPELKTLRSITEACGLDWSVVAGGTRELQSV